MPSDSGQNQEVAEPVHQMVGDAVGPIPEVPNWWAANDTVTCSRKLFPWVQDAPKVGGMCGWMPNVVVQWMEEKGAKQPGKLAKQINAHIINEAYEIYSERQAIMLQ